MNGYTELKSVGSPTLYMFTYNNHTYTNQNVSYTYSLVDKSYNG